MRQGGEPGTIEHEKPWKSADGVTTGAKLLIDFGSAKAVDAIALINHNLRSGSTLTVRGGTVTDPDGTDFNTTITYRTGLSWKLLSSAETWRYWSFELDDNGHPDNHTRAGYAMLGVAVVLSTNFRHEWEVTPFRVVRQVENELATPMVGANIADGYAIAVEFTIKNTTERNEIRDFLQGLQLGVDPILLVPDPGDTEAYFARLQEGWSLSNTAPNFWNINGVEFKTDGFGLVTG